MYSAQEIFEMAEEIERNGAKFYRAAAKLFKNPVSHKKLLELAAMEEEHERVFAAMRADVLEQKAEEVVYDPDQEAAVYIRAIAEGQVFDIKADPLEKLKGVESAEEILEMAIGMEKNSIVFYLGLKEVVSSPASKNKIDALIREEMGHISVLSEELSSIRG